MLKLFTWSCSCCKSFFYRFQLHRAVYFPVIRCQWKSSWIVQDKSDRHFEETENQKRQQQTKELHLWHTVYKCHIYWQSRYATDWGYKLLNCKTKYPCISIVNIGYADPITVYSGRLVSYMHISITLCDGMTFFARMLASDGVHGVTR